MKIIIFKWKIYCKQWIGGVLCESCFSHYLVFSYEMKNSLSEPFSPLRERSEENEREIACEFRVIFNSDKMRIHLNSAYEFLGTQWAMIRLLFSRNWCTANTAIEHLWLQIKYVFLLLWNTKFRWCSGNTKREESEKFEKQTRTRIQTGYTHLFALDSVVLNVAVHIEM